MNETDLAERLLTFAVRGGRLVRSLPGCALGRQIAGQLIRSCTSPAPNYEEACASESRRDFIHKLSICLKELRESRSWLRMDLKADLVSGCDVDALLDECEQLCRIIGKSVVTAKRRTESRKR